MAYIVYEVQFPSGHGKRVLSPVAAISEVDRYGGAWFEMPMRSPTDTDAEWHTFKDAHPKVRGGVRRTTDSQNMSVGIE